ncbi:phenylacetic acid degradation protein PaaN [Cupriavidus basilensis]|nr:phenylacetic acid degradation protein PaaN [Cupriavidus basilensis]
MTTPLPDALFARHAPRLERAWQACRERHCWSPFPEMPARYPDSEAAQAASQAALDAMLDQPFTLAQPGITGWLGYPDLPEVSPYTRRPLGIRYPQSDPDALFEAASAAISAGWRQATPQQRVGVLMEIVEQLYVQLFDTVQAVFHTTGQSFNMSYAGSGVNALDRAIEAIAHAWDAMRQVPASATWERQFGTTPIALDKRYRLMPRGVAVCFACASFPTWNAWPSIMASLATGNAVIVKPHPATVLPMALTVRLMRAQLAAAGFDPNLVTLALDTPAAPLGKVLVRHPRAAIVDFTGSARFGQWVERNAHPALCFTETSGCNTVVLESCDDLDAVLRSLATTLCMFSAQMCTSPQNLYVPRQGVRTPAGVVPLDVVAQRLAQAVATLIDSPARAAMILAAIQSDETLALLDTLQAQGAARGKVLLAPAPYPHPHYPQARTATPLMLQLTTAERDLYAQERFGPVSFVIACDDAADALKQATSDVRVAGGLTAFLYSTDAGFIARAEDAYAEAGAQLTINLSGPMPLNFAAAYSDYHVSGLNPAGNASLTDHAFVASRFRIAQARWPRQA